MNLRVSYISPTDRHPRGAIDMPRFAADLAKELGGTVQPDGDYPHENQKIALAGGKEFLRLTADNWKRRVKVTVAASDIREYRVGDSAQHTESATLNPDGRAIAAIARDIKRRVIDASQRALAAQRAWAAQQIEDKASVQQQSDALKAKHPALYVRVDHGGLVASISGGATGHYISARMEAGGRVTVERLGTVTAEQFDQIVEVLNRKA